MSNLTSELNLSQAVDDDDTADYLTIGLADSLNTIDGLFNSSTGHAHNGAHQGGDLQFLDLTVGQDLTVVGATDMQGPALARSTLHVVGQSTLDAAVTMGSTLNVTGVTTLSAQLVCSANVSVGTDLAVTRDLNVGRNAIVTSNLTAGAVNASGGTISSMTINSPTINGTISGQPIFSYGPITTDWHRNNNTGTGIFNQAVNQGIAFDSTGSFMYPSGDRIVGNTLAATLTNKNLVNPRQQSGSGFVTTGNDLTNYMFTYGTGTYTLPAPSAAYVGVFRAVKAYGGAVTVNCAGAMIGPGNNASTVSLNNGDSVTCWCDGTNWWVL